MDTGLQNYVENDLQLIIPLLLGRGLLRMLCIIGMLTAHICITLQAMGLGTQLTALNTNVHAPIHRQLC